MAGSVVVGELWVGLILILIAVSFSGSFFALLQLVAGKRRAFEEVFLDYAVGVVLEATVLCLILGQVGPDPSSLSASSSSGPLRDSFFVNMREARWWRCLLILCGGLCIGVANVLNLRAAALIGQAAIPISLGLSSALATYWAYILEPDGNAGVLTAGVLCLVAGIVLNSAAYLVKEKEAEGGDGDGDGGDVGMKEVESGSEDTEAMDEGIAMQMVTSSVKLEEPGAAAESSLFRRAVFIAVVAGLTASASFFFAFLGYEQGVDGQLGLYTQVFYFALGNSVATLIMSSLMLWLHGANGTHISPREWWERGTLKDHLKGVGVGFWNGTGFVLLFISADSPLPVVVAVALFQLQPIIALGLGVVVFKEYHGVSTRVRVMVALSITAFLAAALIFLVPVYEDDSSSS